MTRLLSILLLGVALLAVAAAERSRAAPIGVEDARPPVEGLGVLSGEAVLTYREGRGIEVAPIGPLESYEAGRPGALVEILSAIRARDARRAAEAADDDIYSTKALDELTRLLADQEGAPPFHLSTLRAPGVLFEAAQRPPEPKDRWFRVLSGAAWDGPPVLIVVAMLAAFGVIFWASRRLLPTRR